jgi:hypothetical protein
LPRPEMYAPIMLHGVHAAPSACARPPPRLCPRTARRRLRRRSDPNRAPAPGGGRRPPRGTSSAPFVAIWDHAHTAPGVCAGPPQCHTCALASTIDDWSSTPSSLRPHCLPPAHVHPPAHAHPLPMSNISELQAPSPQNPSLQMPLYFKEFDIGDAIFHVTGSPTISHLEGWEPLDYKGSSILMAKGGGGGDRLAQGRGDANRQRRFL